MSKPKYTVRSRHVDGSHLVGRYASYARAVKAIAEKCGGLDWTSATRGVGMYGDVVTISVPEGAPAPPPLKDWEPNLDPPKAEPTPEPAVYVPYVPPALAKLAKQAEDEDIPF